MTEKLSTEELRKQAQELRARSNHDRDESHRLLAEARRIELAERRAKEAAENAAHLKRMFEEIGQSFGLNEAQHSIVYALAWDKGHSSGFAEVSEYYEEFAEMAHKILDAR